MVYLHIFALSPHMRVTIRFNAGEATAAAWVTAVANLLPHTPKRAREHRQFTWVGLLGLAGQVPDLGLDVVWSSTSLLSSHLSCHPSLLSLFSQFDPSLLIARLFDFLAA